MWNTTVLYLCLCVWVCTWMPEDNWGVSFHPSPHECQGVNSGLQGWQQAPLPAELSCWPWIDTSECALIGEMEMLWLPVCGWEPESGILNFIQLGRWSSGRTASCCKPLRECPSELPESPSSVDLVEVVGEVGEEVTESLVEIPILLKMHCSQQRGSASLLYGTQIQRKQAWNHWAFTPVKK